MKYSKEITASALAILSIIAIVNYIVVSQDKIDKARISPQVLVVPDVQEKTEEKAEEQPTVYNYEGTYEAIVGEDTLVLRINGGGAGVLESYENGKHVTRFGDWNNEEISLTIKGDDDKGSYIAPLTFKFSREEDGSLLLSKESLLLSDNDLFFKKITEEGGPKKEESME